MKKIIYLAWLLCGLNTTALAEDKLEFAEADALWLRAGPPKAMMQAAYVDLSNATDQVLKLTGAYSPAFAMTEIHKTEIVDGMARMRHQPEIILQPGETVSMQPGGLHIMLMRPQQAIEEGKEIRICLIYTDDTGQEHVQHLDFPVRKAE